MMVLLLVPFWVSELIRVYGCMILLRESGDLNQILIKIGVFNQPVELLYNDITMVIGQFSFITTIATMIISARLKKLDRTLEEAVFNLGATKFEVIWFITLKYLRPSIIGGAAIDLKIPLESFII